MSCLNVNKRFFSSFLSVSKLRVSPASSVDNHENSSVPNNHCVLARRNFSFDVSDFLQHGTVVESFSKTGVVLKSQNLLLQLHDYTGLSWWSTIVLSTLLIRTTIVLPMAMHQYYVSAKLENIQVLLDTVVKDNITKKVNRQAELNNWNSSQMRKQYLALMKQARTDLIIKHNCHPMKTVLLLFVQSPVWLCLSTSIRNFAYGENTELHTAYMQMKDGGLGWFSDLTVPDPLILPVLLFFVNMSVIYFGKMSRINRNSRGTKFMLYIGFAVSIVIIGIASTVPACLALYWLISSAYGMVQHLVFLSPRVRAFCRIPMTDSMRRKPYRFLVNRILGTVRMLK